VKETELEDIFKPFIRGISGSQTIGNGLGLAITKQVIEAHGGSVAAKNLKPKGFSIQIMLPY
jgi:two-component system, OmpR family, sensor kinase